MLMVRAHMRIHMAGRWKVADSTEHLRALVEALDGAFISSWQSTAAWQQQLDAAREHIRSLDEEPRHD